MVRDTQKLSQEAYDILVVGGGIHGAFVAWDATLRGFKVACIDKDDFGSATSANSLKTVHGGLRYLQDGDLRLVRKMIKERKAYMHIAPHLVHPLPCVMPTYRPLKKNKFLLTPALVLNDLIGSDRNKGLDPISQLPQSKALSKAELLKRLPGIDPDGVTGGVSWYDGQIYNSERFLLSILMSAENLGANIANYVCASELLYTSASGADRVIGVSAIDQLTDEPFEIKAAMVVNATGAWTDQLLDRAKKPRFRSSTAINLVTRKFIDGTGAGIFGHYQPDPAKPDKKSRLLFVSPWRDCSIIGTLHDHYDGDPAEHEVTSDTIQSLLDEVNEAYPAANLTTEDVKLVHRGFLPTKDDRGGDVKLVRKGQIHDHAAEDNIEGLVSVVGVKYTTAREVAERTVDLIAPKLGLPEISFESTTAHTPIFGGNFLSLQSLLADAQSRHSSGLSLSQLTELAYTYGREYETILFLMDKECDETGGTAREKMITSQVKLAVREEMAITLIDVIRRRTDLGSAEYPGDAMVEFCAQIMAEEHEWDRDRTSAEIKVVRHFYNQPEKEKKLEMA